MPLSDQERAELANAKALLEKPSLAIKLSDTLGYPIERGLALLPSNWSGAIERASHEALKQALHFAVVTMDERKRETPSTYLHKMLVAATGAVGGLAGLASLAVELPISTTIMLRSIADIARSEGEDIRSLDCRMACLEVFALGGKTGRDDAAETGYFAVRAVLSRGMSDALRQIAQRGVIDETAPAIVRLVAAIAARFQVAVSEKMVAQALPVLGAVGGAVVNTLFIDHFQDMARGHFTVRRLERLHGAETIRTTYEALD